MLDEKGFLVLFYMIHQTNAIANENCESLQNKIFMFIYLVSNSKNLHIYNENNDNKMNTYTNSKGLDY